MNIAIVLCDEYAVMVDVLLCPDDSARFSILAVNLSIAVGKWIVVFRKPDGETVNATMPNYFGIWLDVQRFDEPVRTFTTYFDDLYIDLRVYRRLVWGSHREPFLIVVEVCHFAELLDDGEDLCFIEVWERTQCRHRSGQGRGGCETAQTNPLPLVLDKRTAYLPHKQALLDEYLRQRVTIDPAVAVRFQKQAMVLYARISTTLIREFLFDHHFRSRITFNHLLAANEENGVGIVAVSAPCDAAADLSCQHPILAHAGIRI